MIQPQDSAGAVRKDVHSLLGHCYIVGCDLRAAGSHLAYMEKRLPADEASGEESRVVSWTEGLS